MTENRALLGNISGQFSSDMFGGYVLSCEDTSEGQPKSAANTTNALHSAFGVAPRRSKRIQSLETSMAVRTTRMVSIDTIGDIAWPRKRRNIDSDTKPSC